MVLTFTLALACELIEDSGTIVSRNDFQSRKLKPQLRGLGGQRDRQLPSFIQYDLVLFHKCLLEISFLSFVEIIPAD